MVRTTIAWTDKIPADPDDPHKKRVPIHAVAFKPDGTQLLAAGGARIYIYDSQTSDLRYNQKAHQGTTYCVAWDRTGDRFATGGSDGRVVIWKATCEGELHYTHYSSQTTDIGESGKDKQRPSPVQCLAFNPITHVLVSGAEDFAFCYYVGHDQQQQQIVKTAMPSRVLCCAWTPNGQHLALGMFNGTISFRNRLGEAVAQVQRNAPIWTLAWDPVCDDVYDILAVGCWDQTLSFYSIVNPKPIGERKLGFDPCTVSYFSNGEYLVVGGSDRKATLWTKRAVKLKDLALTGDWVWTAAQKPKSNFFALGTDGGLVAAHQLAFQIVHGLYQTQYAYRDGMTNVVVDNLVTEKRLAIPCKQYVRRVAIYKDRLAIQMTDQVLIYELYADDRLVDNTQLRARLLHQLNRQFDCTLLVMTKSHLVLCWEQKLQLFTFTGVKVREWVLDAPIWYMKVVGGPPEREALVAGLKNGQVLRIFIDNPFPIGLVQLPTSIRSLDLSASRMKLGVVDDSNTVSVFDLTGTRPMLFKEQNATSVAWNADHEDMLCFAGNGLLNIKTGLFPCHQQKLIGHVVGFKASKIFCLHYVKVTAVDVPQSASMYRYLAERDFERAYAIACLGVTETDWRTLAVQALANQKTRIARKSFVRIRDVRYVDLLNRLEIEMRQPNVNPDQFVAEIYAHQGRYADAAKVFKRIGRVDRAVDMYADLRMWPEAQELCETEERATELVRQRARWAEEIGEWREAALAWAQAGNNTRAIIILGDRGVLDPLIDLCRTLPKSETESITLCAQYFRKRLVPEYAEEALVKIGDTRGLVSLYVEFKRWESAKQLAAQHPEFITEVYVPYAEALLLEDKFDEAQAAYKTARRPSDALRMLYQLAVNGVTQRRFDTAAFYFWRLAIENLRVVEEEEKAIEARRKEAAIEANAAAKRAAAAATAGTGGGGGGAATAAVAAASAASAAAKGAKALGGKVETVRGAVYESSGLSDAALQRCKQFLSFYQRSQLYYAYSKIQHFTEVPFTDMDLTTLFHTCRYLLLTLSGPAAPECPAGVSRLNVLHALAKLSMVLEAFALARKVYEQLRSYVLPRAVMQDMDIQNLLVCAKPQSDKDDLKPVCYRCSTQNPLLHPKGDICSNCSHPFIRNLHTYEHLPLVEFVLHNFTHTEAEAILNSGDMGLRGYRAKDTEYLEEKGLHGDPPANADDEAQLAEDFAKGLIDSEVNERDPFQVQVLRYRYSKTTEAYKPVVVTESMFRSMKRDEVFVVRWPTKAVPPRYYRNIYPEVVLYQCDQCNHFFHEVRRFVPFAGGIYRRRRVPFP